MSEVDARFVKRGLWTNLSQGNVMGKTITTDSTTGIIIVALMAVLSTMGTSHLWSILLFIYHQIRANGHPADGLFRQQQALLRTLPPPSSLIAESAKLWWCWRKQNEKVFLRSLVHLLLATSCTAGFIAAGIATSLVVSNTDLEVLVLSPLCGSIDYLASMDASRNYVATVSTTSVPYAEECYREQTLLPARCKAYVHPRISFTTERAACPFDQKFCIANTSASNPAVLLDSGLVDLNDGFGFNLPDRDRISYRRRTTCAVLSLEGRTSIVNASDFPDALQANRDIPGEQLLLTHYGERTALSQWKNTTTFLSLLYGNFSSRILLSGVWYSAAADRVGLGNAFVPLDGLRRDDADVVLKFLASTVEYNHPVDDPWLSAHKKVNYYEASNGKNVTHYAADSPITSMGCSVQHQFCIRTGSGEHCSKLDSLPWNVTSQEWEGASALQLSALRLITSANQYVALAVANTLKIQNLVRTSVITAQVPSDQWVSEVQRWEAFVWASSQVTIADYAIGPHIRDPGMTEHIIRPTSAADQTLCKSLKMRKAGGFVNINVFAMAFVVATTLFFAIIDIVLLKFLIHLSTFRKALSPRIERWVQDGVLQLQRRAYEAHKEGTWSGLSKEVPLTKAKQLLAELPLTSLPSANSSAVSTPPIGTQSNSAAPTQSAQAPTITPQPTLPQSNPSQHPPAHPTSRPATPPQSPLSQTALPQFALPQPTLAQSSPPPAPLQKPTQPHPASHPSINQAPSTP